MFQLLLLIACLMNPAFAVTPSGPIALPKSLVCDMVANSATFQARIGVNTQTAAYEKVFYTFKRASAADHRSLRPYATVLTTPQLSYELDAGGFQNYLLPSGTVGLLLVDNDDQFSDITNASIDFENFCGGVLADVQNQSALSGNLAIIRAELLQLDRLPQDAELSEGCWWQALLAFEWQA